MILADPGKSASYIAARRRETLRLADWAAYEALLVTNIKNIRYLSGFSGTTAMMLLTGSGAWFITDFRYTAQAAGQTRGISIREDKDPLDGAALLAAELGIKSLGFEADHLTVSTLGKMEEKLRNVKLLPTAGVVEKARLIKDAAEIEAMERLVEMLAGSMDLARSLIRPGARERDVCAELERAMRLRGADGPAFELIVASGPRGALPHGVASEKIIEKEEAVTLDWGARGWGYHSDNTRTFLPRGGGGKIGEIYKVVLEANMAAIEAVKPGVSLALVDSAARGIINKAGYGEYFGHGTGHGVGLDIHEAPRVGAATTEEAMPGMVFTIEPGIYLPGVGGVRIEDMVFVTQTGARNLSEKIPKSPESMALG
jgi:Xaa-Pro aminopeptidase